MSIPLKIAVALTLGVLCCVKEIQTFSDELNRFYHNWTRLDSIAMLLGPVVLAISFLGLHFSFRKRPVFKKVEMCAILFIVAQAVITYFWPRSIGMMGKLTFLIGVWLLVGGIMFWAFRNPGAVGFKFLRESILIFSPIVVIIGATIFNWSTWPSPVEALPSDESVSEGKNPVFVFFFDAWSARRSLGEDGEFLGEFKNMRQIASESYVFQNANSANHSTFPSIPNSLYLVDDDFSSARKRYLLENSIGPSENLFGIAKAAGYAAYLVGFKIPYRNLLGESGGTVRSYPFDPKPIGILGRVFSYLRNNCLFSKNPVSMLAKTYFYRRILSEHWVSLNEVMLQDTYDVISSCPDNSLSVFHLPVPHSPFVFDKDGNYKGPFEGHEPMGKDLAGYRDHLGYLDTVIGRIIAKMKEAGKYDDSLIVMTGDHSWIEDVYEGSSKSQLPLKRHVPLIIKYPGQTQGVKVPSQMDVLDVSHLLKKSLEGGRGNLIDIDSSVGAN